MQRPNTPTERLNTQTGAEDTANAPADPSQSRAPGSDKQDAVAPPSQAAGNADPQPSTALRQSQGVEAEAKAASEQMEPGKRPIAERKHKKQQEEKQPQHAALSAGVKVLKPRKKDFLKRRKLKKKGLLHLLDEEPEEDLEAELMQDRHKPRFGEQAMAPLKASVFYMHSSCMHPQRGPLRS